MRPRLQRQPQPPGDPAASPPTAIPRLLLAHLAWSLVIAVGAGALIGIELASPCPPGGPLALGDCVTLRPFTLGVLGLGAALYVGGLTAVLAWVTGLARRGVADATAARDWYLLAVAVGLPIAPLLAFTIVSALR
ncbi:MAG: hypothetical protein WD402_02975 [Chloroflexota bacterium]